MTRPVLHGVASALSSGRERQPVDHVDLGVAAHIRAGDDPIDLADHRRPDQERRRVDTGMPEPFEILDARVADRRHSRPQELTGDLGGTEGRLRHRGDSDTSPGSLLRSSGFQ